MLSQLQTGARIDPGHLDAAGISQRTQFRTVFENICVVKNDFRQFASLCRRQNGENVGPGQPVADPAEMYARGDHYTACPVHASLA